MYQQGVPFMLPPRPYPAGPIGTGMLVKAEPGSILSAATGHHKMDNGGGHSNDHQSAVALVNQPGGGQMVNGSSAVSQNGSSGRSSPIVDPSPCKLFVGGLSWQTTSDRLREYFGAYGTIKDVLIMKDPITQRSRGFGFITFSDPNSVEKVIAIGNHVLDGKKIDPKHATPKNRGRSNRTKKIFVGGVSQETSAEEVKHYFSQHGKVNNGTECSKKIFVGGIGQDSNMEDVKRYFETFGKVEEAVMLMDNQTKRHRGFGFVTFECEDVVEKVCTTHFHLIKNKKVECKKAQPKEAVQTASLFAKRLMLPGPGIAMAGMTAGMTGNLISAQQQAAAFAASAQAAATYGKLMSNNYPALSTYRYTPYPLPPTASAQHQSNVANSVVSHLQHQSSDARYWPPGASHHHHHHQQQQQQQHQQHAAIAAAVAAAPPPPSTPQAAAAAYTATAGHPHHAALTAATPAPAASHHTGHSMVATMPSHTQAGFTSPTTLAPPPHPSFSAAGQATLAAAPYQGYSLANIDMSSFQGIDWSGVYGMGMYT